MFIFGWGHRRTKNYGECYPVFCENCQNETFYTVMKLRDWFTLFFVPVIPYRKEYWLLCPICGVGYELENRNERKRAVEMANTAREYAEDKIPEEDWVEDIERFEKAWIGVETNAVATPETEQKEIDTNQTQIDDHN